MAISGRTLFFLAAKVPLQVLFSAVFPYFVFSLFCRTVFLLELHEFLLGYAKAAAFAVQAFGGYGISHFSAAFWAVGHEIHLISIKRVLGDISLRLNLSIFDLKKACPLKSGLQIRKKLDVGVHPVTCVRASVHFILDFPKKQDTLKSRRMRREKAVHFDP